MSDKLKYSSIELFAGAGGLALGLELAGFRHLSLVELDTVACRTLKRNRPLWNVVNRDIESFTDDEIKQLANREKVDLLSGGPPCQAFSYAGKKYGFKDRRGSVIKQFFKFVHVLSPKIVLIENVKGLTSHNGGATLEFLLGELSALGYRSYARVLNAKYYEVAQKRERLFIVGVNGRYGERFTFPAPVDSRLLTLRDVIDTTVDRNISAYPGVKYPPKREKILQLVPPGGSWIDLPRDVQREYLGKSYHSGGGKRGIARRLSWDEQSLTLMTSPMQKQTERCHPAETRPLNIREYALIQSFPKEYAFEGSVSSVYRQIGNAVPVNLARHIGSSIKLYLDRICSEAQQANHTI